VLTEFRNPISFARRSHANRRSLAIIAALAATLAVAGCHKKKVAPTPPPPPAATAPAPTASITATPDTITAGQSVVLTWKTEDASSASIEGIGPVPTSGTRTVQPTESTDFNLTATGDGGTANATAHVTVNAATTAPVQESNITEQQFEENVKPVFYDYDSYSIRPDAQSVISQNASYLNQHPNLKVVIGGYCDERGSVEYNLALGENRANAAKQALVNAGVSPDRLRTVSYGKEKQFCTDHTESCWQQNRRAQFTLDQ
jgi:peptidoglycan-associated lipoprotein